MTMKITSLLSKFLLLVTASLTMPHRANAQAGSFVAQIPEPNRIYDIPAEDEEHEGTWLTWPHNYGWDSRHVQRYETMYVEITKALHTGEKVHIVVYDSTEQNRVYALLNRRGLDMGQIDFLVAPTDDVWARDNGPIFAYDSQTNDLVVQDWRFNGWGNKADYWLDNAIPGHVSRSLGMPLVNVNMVNEGGSFEVDGYGTFMAKKSSIINSNRNPTWTQSDIEDYFRKYLGVTNFIWLVGTKGLDITDDHIDGTAKFAPGGKIVTLKRSDFIRPTDYDILNNARKANGGSKYKLVFLPMTQHQYLTGGVMDYATYINYYVGNAVVIVPAYGDPSDAMAVNVLKGVYPDREIVPINMLELYKDGGLVHCITQQQLIATRN